MSTTLMKKILNDSHGKGVLSGMLLTLNAL